MKVKTSELVGSPLNWTVAQCVGRFRRSSGKGMTYFQEVINYYDGRPTAFIVDSPECRAELRLCDGDNPFFKDQSYFQPSTVGSQGLPIVEQEQISVVYQQAEGMWVAVRRGLAASQGETLLIAAMRCYVASKLGDEVDIPEELL